MSSHTDKGDEAKLTDEQGRTWTLPELLDDLDEGGYLYLTPKMCGDLAAVLRAAVSATVPSPASSGKTAVEVYDDAVRGGGSVFEALDAVHAAGFREGLERSASACDNEGEYGKRYGTLIRALLTATPGNGQATTNAAPQKPQAARPGLLTSGLPVDPNEHEVSTSAEAAPSHGGRSAHAETDRCGFDRNASIVNDCYTCTCGYVDREVPNPAPSSTPPSQYDVVADAVQEIADAAEEAFRKAGLTDPGEWDSDNIVQDVKRGIVSAIERLAATRSATAPLERFVCRHCNWDKGPEERSICQIGGCPHNTLEKGAEPT